MLAAKASERDIARIGDLEAETVGNGIAIRQGNPELLAAMQEALDAMFGNQTELLVELQARKYDVDRWNVNVEDIAHLPGFSPVIGNFDDALNVVGSHHSRTKSGRWLILSGHIDVGPVGSLDMWDTPPFDPRIDDGWMYGRGAGDLKAGLADHTIATLEDAHHLVAGHDLDKIAITATTDARFFGLYADTPTLVYGPKAEAIHGFNERVDLESMHRVTQATAMFIANWCGLDPL